MLTTVAKALPPDEGEQVALQASAVARAIGDCEMVVKGTLAERAQSVQRLGSDLARELAAAVKVS